MTSSTRFDKNFVVIYGITRFKGCSPTIEFFRVYRNFSRKKFEWNLDGRTSVEDDRERGEFYVISVGLEKNSDRHRTLERLDKTQAEKLQHGGV